MPSFVFLTSFVERLADASIYSLLGMGIIFAVLALLWGVLALFNLYFGKQKKKNSDEQSVTPAASDTGAGDEGAVVAAITAAISIILAEEAAANNTVPPQFRVVSFRRAGREQHNKSDR